MFLYIVIGIIFLFMVYIIQLQIRNIIYIRKVKKVKTNEKS